MPGNQKLSVSIKNMGFMKRSVEKVGEETGESRKRKRELQIFEKQRAGDQYNNKKETASGLIIIKDNRSQYSYGRKSFSGYNKPIENHRARNKLKPSPVKDSKKQKRKVTPASKKSKD